jgi:hypothetical protein
MSNISFLGVIMLGVIIPWAMREIHLFSRPEPLADYGVRYVDEDGYVR